MIECITLSVQMIQLTIRPLPPLPAGAKYQCVWGAAPPVDATLTTRGLTCPAPAPSTRPAIPPRRDHALVPLSIRCACNRVSFFYIVCEFQ